MKNSGRHPAASGFAKKYGKKRIPRLKNSQFTLYYWIRSVARQVLEFCLIWGGIWFVLYFFRNTRTINALLGLVVSLLGLSVLTILLDMKVLGLLVQSLWSVLMVAMIVIFQPELRRVFAALGDQLRNVFGHRQITPQDAMIESIANAAIQMSIVRCGALIIFERKIGLGVSISNGVQLEAKVNPLLIRSLFYPNSPLHDGAVIIRNDMIVAAHVILPMSDVSKLQADQITSRKGDPASAKKKPERSIGTRHRAAIGISEETDAVALVVSEETGEISVACGGRLVRGFDEASLLVFLKEKLMGGKKNEADHSIEAPHENVAGKEAEHV